MSQPTGDPTQGVGADPSSQSGAGSDPNVDPAANQDPTQPPAATGKTYTEAEYHALQARMQAADRNRAAAQTKLEEIERQGLSEAEKTKRDLEAAQKQLEELKAANQERALENAFLTDNTYSWHNSTAALRLLEREGVQIGDDGKVSGMKAAIDKLAKEHAYLIKTADGGQTDPGPSGVTGVPGNASPKGGVKNQDALAKKFPALRGRVASS